MSLPFPDFDPVIVQLGPFALRWYALAYIAGIALGWAWGRRLSQPRFWASRPPPLTRPEVDDFVLWVALGIILGGRIGYVIFYHPDWLVSDPLQMLMIWNGGMSFHGGFLGVCAATILFSRVKHADLLSVADLTAPCVPLGLLFGRLANFIHGELWGRPTDVPWGVVFPSGGDAARHPSQLYEAGLEGFVLFMILLWATHRAFWLPRRGRITGLFLVFYALFRIVVETVREPDPQMPAFPFDLTMGPILSFPVLAAGVWLLTRRLAVPHPVARAPR